jgi:hypothetical protein
MSTNSWGTGLSRKGWRLSLPVPPDILQAPYGTHIDPTYLLTWDRSLWRGDTLDGKTCQQRHAPSTLGRPSIWYFINDSVNKFWTRCFNLLSGKKKVPLYCNSQLGAFLTGQMLIQCAAYILNFLPLIFVWLILQWGLGASEQLWEVRLHHSISQHLPSFWPRLWIFFQQHLWAWRQHTSCFSSHPVRPRGVNQCKLEIGQTA